MENCCGVAWATHYLTREPKQQPAKPSARGVGLRRKYSTPSRKDPKATLERYDSPVPFLPLLTSRFISICFRSHAPYLFRHLSTRSQANIPPRGCWDPLWLVH